MEGLAFILIGGVLFSQSWHLLGLYSDGRTVGLFVGVLGLALLISLTVDPLVFVGGNVNANPVAEIGVMKILILAWAGYAIGVAAHGLWDFDDRAIGFYGAFLTAVSAISLVYFSVKLYDAYGDGIGAAFSVVTLILAGLAAIIFFYLAVPFAILRLVAGWFLLFGSSAVVAIGLAIATTLIEVD